MALSHLHLNNDQHLTSDSLSASKSQLPHGKATNTRTLIEKSVQSHDPARMPSSHRSMLSSPFSHDALPQDSPLASNSPLHPPTPNPLRWIQKRSPTPSSTSLACSHPTPGFRSPISWVPQYAAQTRSTSGSSTHRFKTENTPSLARARALKCTCPYRDSWYRGIDIHWMENDSRAFRLSRQTLWLSACIAHPYPYTKCTSAM